MQATVVYCRNPLSPALGREVMVLARRTRLDKLAPKTRLPFVCLRNGEAVLRARWKAVRVQNGDVVQFVTLPSGGGGGGDGGGKNPIATVAMIAVMVFAPEIAPMLLPAGAPAWAVTAAKIGLVVAGGFLVNAAFGSPPRQPPTHQAQSMAAPSPTYNLQAQGNAARLGEPIPSWYGYHIIYPDLAAEPYTEFAGNEQFLYQLHCIGQGEYDVASIRIEDTPAGNFEEVTTQLVAPGGSVTLFPSNVITSVEVAGQELADGVYSGPFVANAAATAANYIGIDVVCPRGLYYANAAGGLDQKTITFEVEARTIDDAGAPTGAFVQIGAENITGATNTPIRRSYRYAVAAARYEVRAKRTNAKDLDARAGHEINWTGLRAYLPGAQAYGQVTMLAVRMKASGQLSSQSARRINVIATRKLPSWSPGGGWAAAAATRSIVWAAADICRAAYGGALPDNLIDLNALYALDATWTARGDRFDGGFDQRLGFWEALTQVLRAGRAKPFMQGGVMRFARDAAAAVPVGVFTPRNILPGTWKSEYLLPSEDRADTLEVTYFEKDVWQPKTVTCTPPGITNVKPGKLKLFGVIERAHAGREGMYEAAANRYRNRVHTFQTELEGKILSPLDPIAISRDKANWGTSGAVLSFTGADGLNPPGINIGGVLELSEPVAFGGGNHYIAMRKRDGSMAGPYLVTAGADATHVVLGQAVAGFQPDVGATREKSAFMFGPGTAYRVPAVVMWTRPKSEHIWEIACVAENDLVHTADGTAPPAAPAGMPLAKPPTAPTVEAASIKVVQSGTPAKPVLNVSWNTAPGASTYMLEYSYDQAMWTRISDLTSTHTSFGVEPGAVYLRIAAIGVARGAWASPAVVNAGSGIAPPPNVANLVLEEAFTGPVAKFKWDASARTVEYRVRVLAGDPLAVVRTRDVQVPRFEYSYAEAIADGGPWRDFTLEVAAIGSNGTLSAAYTQLAVSNPKPSSPLSAELIAGPNSIAASVPRPADADLGKLFIWRSTAQGFTPGAGNLVYAGPDSGFTFNGLAERITYYFRFAWSDLWGESALNTSLEFSATTTFTAGAIERVAALPGGYAGQVVFLTSDSKLYRFNELGVWTKAVDGADILAATVTAQQISVAQLSAIAANMGDLTTGTITLNSTGHIKSGQTDWNNGSGWFLGRHGAEAAFSMGDGAEDYLTYKPSKGLKIGLRSFEIELAEILSSILVNSWTQEGSPSAIDRYDVCWGSAAATNTTDGAFVLVGASGAVIDGTDKEMWYSTGEYGGTWSEATHPKNFALHAICEGSNGLGGRQLIAVGEADGADAYIVRNLGSSLGGFGECANPKNIALNGIAYSPTLGSGSGRYCAVGNPDGGADVYIVTSDDAGATWAERAGTGEVATLNDICWDAALALFVAVGEDGANAIYIATSPDGINWTKRNALPALSNQPFAMTVASNGAGLLAAAGGFDAVTGGWIATSPDGINWTSRTTAASVALGGTRRINKMIHNGSIFVGVGEANGVQATLLSSSDGIRWTMRPNPRNIALNGIAWSGKGFAAVGDLDGTKSYVARSLVVT